MIMQTVSLCDDVAVEITEGEFSSQSNLRFIPNDDRNLAVKAAKAFFSAAGESGGARININKRIPVGSGMEEAVKHCTQGIGIWDWASNDQGQEPDIVMPLK